MSLRLSETVPPVAPFLFTAMRSCALLAAVVAACVALLCVTAAVTPVAALVDPGFPSIPDAYSAVVSVNYAALNFSLAWSESWSDASTAQHSAESED